MKVGIDLREIRVGVSGGLRRALNGVLEELIRTSPDDEFHVFVRDAAAVQLWKACGAQSVEILDDSLDCGAVDRRASSCAIQPSYRVRSARSWWRTSMVPSGDSVIDGGSVVRRGQRNRRTGSPGARVDGHRRALPAIPDRFRIRL